MGPVCPQNYAFLYLLLQAILASIWLPQYLLNYEIIQCFRELELYYRFLLVDGIKFRMNILHIHHRIHGFYNIISYFNPGIMFITGLNHPCLKNFSPPKPYG